MDLNQLYAQHGGELEDFWGRRTNVPQFERWLTLFGRPLRVCSNHERVLEAVEILRPQYSLAAETPERPFEVQFVVRPTTWQNGPPPENLFAINQYSGDGRWLSIQIGGWGHCHIDLMVGRATAVLATELAERPDIVAHGLLNTIYLNLLIGSGLGMLHCTGLLYGSGRRALLLMAPHNTGKSTTALRLVLGGYTLLSDSQVYVSMAEDKLHLLGWPVGKTKLRRDMVPYFPELHSYLAAELVRDETKHSMDLREIKPELVCDTAVFPETIDLCLLTRSGRSETILQPATEEEAWTAIMQNSIYYDDAAAWMRNLAPLAQLVEQANFYHLAIGTDGDGIVAAVRSTFW